MPQNLDSTPAPALINATNKISITKCGRFVVGPGSSPCVPFKICFPSGTLAIRTLIRWLTHSHELHYNSWQSTLKFLSLALISLFKSQNLLSVCWIFPPEHLTGPFQLQMSKTKFIITSSLQNLPLYLLFWLMMSPLSLLLSTSFSFSFFPLSFPLSPHAHLCIFKVLNVRHHGLLTKVSSAPCRVPGTQIGA